MCTTSATMAAKPKKVASKLVFWLVMTCHACSARQWTQDMLTREHVSSQETLTRRYISTQGMLTREARKRSKHISTWAKEHTRHIGT